MCGGGGGVNLCLGGKIDWERIFSSEGMNKIFASWGDSHFQLVGGRGVSQ